MRGSKGKGKKEAKSAVEAEPTTSVESKSAAPTYTPPEESQVIHETVLNEGRSEEVFNVRPTPTPTPTPTRSARTSITDSKFLSTLIGLVIIASFIVYAKSLLVAAMVNGMPISRVEVIQELEKRSGGDVIEMMITKELIKQETRKRGVEVTREEIDADIAKIAEQVAAGGMSLDLLLSARGMTLDDLRGEIMVQKSVEKMLAGSIDVTLGEVEQYITDNQITLPEGREEEAKQQIMAQLKDQKLSMEGQALVDGLHQNAMVMKFVSY